MIRSMTGFGRATGTIGSRFTVTVTAKSVNHRYLEVSLRLPESLWDLDPLVRGVAAEKFSRGKLDVSVRAQRIKDPEYFVHLNRKIAEAIAPKMQQVIDEYALEPLSAGDLMRIPDLLSVEALEDELSQSEKDDFRAVLSEAFDRISEMRSAEGKALEQDIRERLASIRGFVERIAASRDSIVQSQLDAYRQRVAEIAAIAGVEIDQDRLAQETVLLVEKGDVAEEMTRLTIHLDQTEALLSSREPAGKKLDFFSQEILREINTLSQKSRSSDLRGVAVDLKTEIERIREQVQNVE